MNIKRIIQVFMITIMLLTSINNANAGVVKNAAYGIIMQKTASFLITGKGKK